MADIKTEKKDSSEDVDKVLINFREPDVSKSVADLENIPNIINKIITLIILVVLISIIISGVFVAKNRDIINARTAYAVTCGIIFIFVLILLKSNRRKKIEDKIETKGESGKEKKKMTIGRAIVIILVVIPATLWSARLIWPPTIKMVRDAIYPLPTATVRWEKNSPKIPGSVRSYTSDAIITRYDKDRGVLEFTSHDSLKESRYRGEINPLNGRFEGSWTEENPRDQGKWFLEQDKRNPRFFSGKLSDGETGSGPWIDFYLEINL